MAKYIADYGLMTSLRPGVAMMPKGGWRKSSFNGFTADLETFAPDTLGTAGGANFNDSRVEVVRLV